MSGHIELSAGLSRVRRLDQVSLSCLDDDGPGMLWLGSLGGYTLEAGPDEDLLLRHRCSNDPLPHDGTGMLGNLVLAALEHLREGCHTD